MVSPAALVGTTVLVLGSSRRRGARTAVGLLAGAFGLAVGVGVSHGRHLAALPVRAAFVVALAATAFVVAFAVAPRLWRALEVAPRACGVAAAAAAIVFELANRWFFPRLYPAFHLGIAALTAMTAPLLGRALRETLEPAVNGLPGSRRPPWRVGTAAVCVVLAVALAPRGARRLSLSDNLRLIFFERAPLIALGVEVSTVLAPPTSLEPGQAPDDARPEDLLEVDWRDKDILLISVDALRADHVGAYGYRRSTTPNLDRLARDGTIFLRAYCPTPHTSYSVTSMMTGKNLRPLLVQGLGLDSDTFASILRTYGYRTAAFYPPAVFFIDEELFAPFRDRQLDFEFARVEFADPHERARSLQAYLDTQPAGRKLFVWVHLFEPHEPYVAHGEHPFGERDVDRYDSEVALADDGIGELVSAVKARRPNTVVIVTADHGEEFGEHNGRYHGTTVYEEQVRVPLVIAGPGVSKNQRVETPVQTIDILPTALAALDIPRPPRVRGRSLGRWLANEARTATLAQRHEATAFVVTDEQAMLGQDEWRLVCARRAGACALHNLDLDPGEARDVSAAEHERFAAMKTSLRRVQASQGLYERSSERTAGARPWPEPIRRGLAGDGDAAREVAALLDDSDASFRRKAAEVLFDLKRKEAAPELRLALSRDEDDVVRRFCALALTRLGEGAPRTVELLADPDPTWRRLAALALAENGDTRGAGVLVAWWQTEPPPYLRARELLAALGQIRAKEAAPVLVGSLDDVRLRPYIAETLAAIGQPLARAPLAERWANERYQNARVALGDALLRLGAKRELVGPLIRFLGTPDPLPGGIDLARRAGVLDRVGGPTGEQLARIRSSTPQAVLAKFTVPPGGNGTGRRIVARAHVTDGRPGHLRVGGRLVGLEPVGQKTRAPSSRGGAGHWVELDPGRAVTLDFAEGPATESFATLPTDLADPEAKEVRLVLLASENLAIEALAVVPLSDDLAPPPPTPWGPGAGASPVSSH